MALCLLLSLLSVLVLRWCGDDATPTTAVPPAACAGWAAANKHLSGGSPTPPPGRLGAATGSELDRYWQHGAGEVWEEWGGMWRWFWSVFWCKIWIDAVEFRSMV